ncbi:MAG: PhoU domain-containing protein [candidate division Zixibacteria bacterium]
MFNKFKELFSSENLLDIAFNTTLTMLDFDYKMYDASRGSLRESDNAELPFDVRKMDKKINKFEREVRRNVLTHLTIAGTQNLVPGLALVSIVIDVERIGDYTKNIAGLAKIHPARLQGGKHESTLKSIEDKIEENFTAVIDVLKTQDTGQARAILLAEEQMGKKSDAIVEDLVVATNKTITTKDAVSLAMYARYLKRINAHLTNIASSIVNPFPRIGFREKKKTSK